MTCDLVFEPSLFSEFTTLRQSVNIVTSSDISSFARFSAYKIAEPSTVNIVRLVVFMDIQWRNLIRNSGFVHDN